MRETGSARYMVAETSLGKAFLDRIITPIVLVGIVLVFGTVGFLLMGGGKWSLLDCAYMTSLTLTTVGYGEVLDQMGPDARVFAMTIMWIGMGVTLYAVSTITAFVVETDLSRILKEKRMEKQIGTLQGHYIVCGVGKIGFHVIKELHATRSACVVIDEDKERLRTAQESFQGLYFLCGDATEETVLVRAGIKKAAGLIAGLNEDSHNLLITVQARYVNPEIKIITRCNEDGLTDKFYRAGANYVVNPGLIGGMRMASEMIRPHVVSFLDRMLRNLDQTVRVEEATVGSNSSWAGRTVGDVDVFGHTGLVPIAIKHPDSPEFFYNPGPGETLQAGTVLIAIGNVTQLARLREKCK